jgi:hypothetical protein
MNGHQTEQRRAPYSNSKMFSPALIWSILVTLVGSLLVGVLFATGLQSSIASNASEIIHVKELQNQENQNTRDQLDDIKSEQQTIKEMLREALKDRE